MKINNPDFTTSYKWKDRVDMVTKFVDELKDLFTKDIPEKATLYMDIKNGISQDKLRNAGFKITRQPLLADLIIVNNPLDEGWDMYNWHDSRNIWCKRMSYESDLGYKYMFVEDIYKALYTHKASDEICNQIESLIKTNNTSNKTMAMEMMTNTDWNGNKMKLAHIFGNYWYDYMNRCSYRTSVSFKGFVNSLDFDHTRVHLDDPMDYVDFCESDADHKWVLDKFDKRLNAELKMLAIKYKINIDEIKHSEDKDSKDKNYNEARREFWEIERNG